MKESIPSNTNLHINFKLIFKAIDRQSFDIFIKSWSKRIVFVYS